MEQDSLKRPLGYPVESRAYDRNRGESPFINQAISITMAVAMYRKKSKNPCGISM